MYAIFAWLISIPDIAPAFEWTIGVVLFLMSSGVAWVAFHHLYEQKRGSLEFKFLKEHGLN